MTGLSLRLRVFLFFALIALGGISIVLLALWMGYRQLDDPQALSALVTIAAVSGFGLAGLAVFVWLLFDENVCKPIERLAASLRVRAHAGVENGFDDTGAQYLGDLAPAVSAIREQLGSNARAKPAESFEKSERQRQQLLRILSDIPVAVIVANADHQIVLYDGQAADLLEVEAPARLNASVFDYLERDAVEKALTTIAAHESGRMEIALKGHSGAVYSGHIRLFGDQAGYTLMLEPLAADAARPLVYDFDLLDCAPAAELAETALSDLSFVVFDSETTGLDPEVDRVLQLGAVRVVNGKLVPGEEFETLVDPGQPIPPQSTKVHGISDDMVAGAPEFTAACRAFHDFARDAVIIAHNAPFDMAFLHRQGRATGLVFEHPVLDTVHLSAIVFGGSAEHTLDALCDRLNVTIPPEARHTALGDAIATAQVFTAMLPILDARGINTFGALRAEAQKHSRILKVQD